MNPPLNEPTPDEPLLEPSHSEGVCPGGLAQPSGDELVQVETDLDDYYLGSSDELGPTETLFVGPTPPDDLVFIKGRTFTTEGEPIYVFDLYLEAGTAKRHYCLPSHLNNHKKIRREIKPRTNDLPIKDNDGGRGRRSAVEFMMLARSNRLAQRIDLDYVNTQDQSHTQPSKCKINFDKYLRRLWTLCGPFPWLEVLEYGERNSRLHHHLLVPKKLDPRILREQWPHGKAVIARTQGLDGIGKLASYMTKTFKQPQHLRPRTRRYRVGRHIKRERPIRIIGTYEIIESTLRKMLPEGTKLRGWKSNHQFSAGGYSWDRPL